MNVEVIRSQRRTLSLSVRDNGTVVVRAPYHVREKEIRSFVQEHIDWVIKQREKMEKAAESRRRITPLAENEIKKMSRDARSDLSGRIAYFAPQIGVTYGRISIRHQKTKWGSCSSKGNLNFNCLLMLAPENVRDYVVVHELCHRKQMNHSAAFWSEVEKVFPEYRTARLWLKKYGPELMMYNVAER